MRRRPYYLATIMTLALFATTIALWVRSYSVCERAYTQHSRVGYGWASGYGRLSVDWWWLHPRVKTWLTRAKAQPVVDEQIQKAGVRLAAALNLAIR